MKTKLVIIILLYLVVNINYAHAGRKWQVYEDAVLLDNPANDGDSFHVRCNNHEYIFRLYFVDTPETDDKYKDRVQAQADYFGISVKQTLKIGHEAAVFTRRKLSHHKFTVYTKKEDARGNSRLRRYFAMIKVDGEWLSSLLVEEGYVRIYGMKTDLPDHGKTMWRYVKNLKHLEWKAKKARKGAWKMSNKLH